MPKILFGFLLVCGAILQAWAWYKIGHTRGYIGGFARGLAYGSSKKLPD